MSSRLLLPFIVFTLLPSVVHALQLGDSREQIVAQYGNPTDGSLEQGSASYRWNGWRLDIEFSQGVAQRLVFTKDTGSLSDAEARQLLNENGGIANWQPVNPAALNSPSEKRWRRTSDGAEAFTSGESPQGMALITKAWAEVRMWEQQSASKNIVPRITVTAPAINHPSDPLNPMVRIISGLVILIGFVAFVGFIAWLVRSSRRKTPAPLLPTNRGLWSPPPLPVSQSACEVTVPSPADVPISNLLTRKSLGDLSWQEFELLIGELYRRQGHLVEMCSGDGSDGGVDLRLRKEEKTTLVQCKHWKVYKVGVSAVRELFGILSAERADHAVFVTTGKFTQDTRSFAEGKPMELIDGDKLQTLLEEAMHGSGGDLLNVESWSAAFAREATIVAPVCPFCHSSMVLRRGKQSGNAFWGCSTYPKCRGKRNVRAELMRT